MTFVDVYRLHYLLCRCHMSRPRAALTALREAIKPVRF